MINISEDYKNILNKKTSLKSRSKIVVENREYISEIKSSPKISHKNKTIIGGFPIKTCSFELMNTENNVDFLDKEVKVYKGIEVNNNFEYVLQGIFIPKKSQIKTNISQKSVQDKGQLFDIPYVSKLNWDVKHTGEEIVQEICDLVDVELATLNFNWSKYYFDKPNFKDGVSCREVISRIAEIGGSIAIINYEGKLEIKSQKYTDQSISAKRYSKLSKEKKYGEINVVILGKKDVNNDIYYPENLPIEKNEYKIIDNPFVDLHRKEMISEVAKYILGLSLTPFEIEKFIDGFCYELNDVISITDKNNNSFNGVILNYETNGRISSKIGADVQDSTLTNYKLAGSTKQELVDVRLDVDNNKKRIDAVVSEQKQIEKDIITSKTAEGNPIEIDDAGEYELQNIQIYGPTSNNSYLELKTSSKNLFNKDDYISFYAHIANGNLSYNAGNKVLIFPCAPNKTYTISKKSGGRFRIGSYPTFEQQGITLSNYNSSDSASSLTITTGSKDRYIYVEYWLNIEEAAENEIIGSIQIETGNKSTSYEEHKENIALIYLNIYDDNKNIIGHYEIDEVDKFDNGILTKSDGTQIELSYENLKLFKGYNYITVKDDLYPNMNIKYLTDSKFNADYATKSEFNMKSNEILSEVNGKFKEYTKTTEMNASIKEQVNSETAKIEISVSQRIEDIQIGGTNLVPNSEEEKVYIPDGWISLCEVEPASYGEEYTISFDAWVVYAQEESGYDGIVAKIGTYIEGDAFAGVKEIHATLTTKPQRITYTYTINNDDEPNAKIFGLGAWADSENETIHYRKIKVEKGNKATDWSPAPEDKANTSQVSRAAIMATITKNGTSSIDMESDEFSLTSKNFSVTKEGIVTALLGIFGGWNIGKDGIWREIRPDYDYTQNDINKVQQYILGQTSLTVEEWKKYDFNKDGIINALELLQVQKLVNYNIGYSHPGKILLTVNDWFRPIQVINGSGEIVASFGYSGVITKEIQ